MLQLKIYKPHSDEVEKVYETEKANVMYGTLQDIAGIVNDNLDINEPNSMAAIGKVVLAAIPVINTLLPEIFEGLTKEEIRRVRTTELIELIIDISLYTAGEITSIGENEGN